MIDYITQYIENNIEHTKCTSAILSHRQRQYKTPYINPSNKQIIQNYTTLQKDLLTHSFEKNELYDILINKFLHCDTQFTLDILINISLIVDYELFMMTYSSHPVYNHNNDNFSNYSYNTINNSQKNNYTNIFSNFDEYLDLIVFRNELYDKKPKQLKIFKSRKSQNDLLSFLNLERIYLNKLTKND